MVEVPREVSGAAVLRQVGRRGPSIKPGPLGRAAGVGQQPRFSHRTVVFTVCAALLGIGGGSALWQRGRGLEPASTNSPQVEMPASVERAASVEQEAAKHETVEQDSTERPREAALSPIGPETALSRLDPGPQRESAEPSRDPPPSVFSPPPSAPPVGGAPAEPLAPALANVEPVIDAPAVPQPVWIPPAPARGASSPPVASKASRSPEAEESPTRTTERSPSRRRDERRAEPAPKRAKPVARVARPPAKVRTFARRRPRPDRTDTTGSTNRSTPAPERQSAGAPRGFALPSALMPSGF